MSRHEILAAAFTCVVLGSTSSAQDVAKVDFGRDVQPLLKQHCVGCHGPAIHHGGFRLDRRADAMRGSTLSPGVIRPGSGDASPLYIRISGTQFGPQMPPAGALGADQIATIKRWIDEGAEWPDALSGETAPTPPDPAASRLMDALRRGDRRAFRMQASAHPNVATLRGPGGTTPLMYAALYGDVDAMRLLLAGGADPNSRNEAGATALMWAVDDREKTRLLLERGADANARSDDGRTPLMIAAGRAGNVDVVRLLLDHGAGAPTRAATPFGQLNPVIEAATAGDEATLRLLIERGANPEGFFPLVLALRSPCAACVDLLLASTPAPLLTQAMVLSAPPFGAAAATTLFLKRGADVNGKDFQGRPMLMLAAAVDAPQVDAVEALLAHGADVNAKSPSGERALGFARQRGSTKIVDLLLSAGAVDTPSSPAAPAAAAARAAPVASPRVAVERALPLLQKTDAVFLKKSGCVSCHNNTLTAMAVAAARRAGVRVDDRTDRAQLTSIATFIDGWRERALQGLGIPGDADTISYILLGLAAGQHAPDAATDAMARYLRSRQRPDGHWSITAHRPPSEASDLQVTAASMRSLQLYAPRVDRAGYRQAVESAAAWLSKAQPECNEDRAFQLLGLAWAGAGRRAVQTAARALLAEQRPDGGWSQLRSLPSDAYATGQALVALKESGALAPSDPAYTKGVRFLLNTQFEDGSWLVKSRAIAFQPLFDIGFPHGPDSWISAAGTNWATMALAMAVRAR
jgi:ankyrin repeat protein